MVVRIYMYIVEYKTQLHTMAHIGADPVSKVECIIAWLGSWVGGVVGKTDMNQVNSVPDILLPLPSPSVPPSLNN